MQLQMLDRGGIVAVYVFDGKPPTMKSGELEKRKEKREEAESALAKAKEEGNMEEVDKQNRRLVKVGTSHVNDCKKLLELMGVPYVSAPCEAEAQCAELVKTGKVRRHCTVSWLLLYHRVFYPSLHFITRI